MTKEELNFNDCILNNNGKLIMWFILHPYITYKEVFNYIKISKVMSISNWRNKNRFKKYLLSTGLLLQIKKIKNNKNLNSNEKEVLLSIKDRVYRNIGCHQTFYRFNLNKFLIFFLDELSPISILSFRHLGKRIKLYKPNKQRKKETPLTILSKIYNNFLDLQAVRDDITNSIITYTQRRVFSEEENAYLWFEFSTKRNLVLEKWFRDTFIEYIQYVYTHYNKNISLVNYLRLFIIGTCNPQNEYIYKIPFRDYYLIYSNLARFDLFSNKDKEIIDNNSIFSNIANEIFSKIAVEVINKS